MDGEAVREIERLAQEAASNITEIDGIEYSTVPLHDPRTPDPEPASLVVATLTSFADYARGPHDTAYRKVRDQFVHVEGPGDVTLYTGLFGEFSQRVAVLEARISLDTGIRFGQWYDHEEFNIALQTNFVQTEELERVRAMVAGLQDQAVAEVNDDGVSQQATVRRGVTQLSSERVPNPVQLQPFRTFLEVDQPSSPFVLRLRGGGSGKPPACALFEADGGLWKHRAIENIKAFLVGALNGSLDVYG